MTVERLPALRADELNDVGRVGGDLRGKAGWRCRRRGSPQAAPELRGRERRLTHNVTRNIALVFHDVGQLVTGSDFVCYECFTQIKEMWDSRGFVTYDLYP